MFIVFSNQDITPTFVGFTMVGMSSYVPPDSERPDAADVAAVSALDVPPRRRLYEYVRGCSDPVSRDEASEALGIARQTAAFHLDKLADVGLVEVEFVRRTRRRGPGAGRPSKLYRRADRDVAVRLPERSYELAGQLLAQAVSDAERTGESARESLTQRAAELGRTIGEATGNSDEELLDALERCGYEPRIDGGEITLANCPFHSLAQQYTELVCGMNRDLITGMLNGAGCAGRRARLAPHERHCCVRIYREQ